MKDARSDGATSRFLCQKLGDWHSTRFADTAMNGPPTSQRVLNENRIAGSHLHTTLFDDHLEARTGEGLKKLTRRPSAAQR